MDWTVASALGATLAVLRRRFLAFFVVALLLTLPCLVVDMIGINPLADFLFTAISDVLVAICLTAGTIRAMVGKKTDFIELLWKLYNSCGTRLFFLTLLQTFAIALGFVLLAVPGLYLLALWAVATPVMIVERTTIGEALNRSVKLTEGRRWSVLGTLVAGGLITGLLALGLVLAFDLHHQPDSNAAKVLRWTISAAIMTVLICVPAVLYVLLRQEKEGVTAQQMAGALD